MSTVIALVCIGLWIAIGIAVARWLVRLDPQSEEEYSGLWLITLIWPVGLVCCIYLWRKQRPGYKKNKINKRIFGPRGH